jgi:phosphate-selective porin OprO/OprP
MPQRPFDRPARQLLLALPALLACMGLARVCVRGAEPLAGAPADLQTTSLGPPPSLEARLRQLEAQQAELAAEVEDLTIENRQMRTQLESPPGAVLGDDGDFYPMAPDGPLLRSPRSGMSSAQWDFDDMPADMRTDEPQPANAETPTSSTFGEGFKWSTADGEYHLAFHNETQLDVRAYEQNDSTPVNQFGFYVSRMRLYFNGSLTEPIEYSVSLNKGLGDLNLLDAYFNFNYDQRLQFRVGRFRVPFTYDWYALSNQFLPTPERSVFAVNYGYNRNWAMMLHGAREDGKGEYALALAVGPRNQYFDSNAEKDFLAYVNVRPFEDGDLLPALNYWNVGGSMAYGIQDQDPRPNQFWTSLNATESQGANEAAPWFLQLNDGVRERGPRHLGEIHSAWYYQQLSLMAAWDVGYNSYSLNDDPDLRVPTSGWHAQFGYFLTGETVTRRTIIEPLEPFDLRPGKRGLGAIELQSRYDEFNVGQEIFTGGFADPNLWTGRVKTLDAGVNWYLNKFTKIYFDWQYARFAQPIPYRPGGTQHSSNLFWTRFQVYF